MHPPHQPITTNSYNNHHSHTLGLQPTPDPLTPSDLSVFQSFLLFREVDLFLPPGSGLSDRRRSGGSAKQEGLTGTWPFSVFLSRLKREVSFCMIGLPLLSALEFLPKAPPALPRLTPVAEEGLRCLLVTALLDIFHKHSKSTCDHQRLLLSAAC